MFAKINYIRKGMIQLWSGSIASIPIGWVLCNGSGGTPDLRNRFLCGAGNSYAPDATGGSATHSHTSDVAHTHSLLSGGAIDKGGVEFLNETGIPLKSGLTGNADNAPLFYALAYIMKL